MHFFDYRLFDRIKRRQGYDPKYPDQKAFMKDLKQSLRLDFGICTENRDPEKKGRVKVHFPHWGENIISSWAHLVRPFGGTQFGLFTLPEVGDKLICMFINGDRSHPIVIGCVYNKSIAKPPLKMKEGNHVRAITSRSGSKIVFNDEDGEEKIQIYMKDGKIRGTFSKSKGIALVNELGDIKVKCRKLTIEAGDAATIKFKKQLKITCKNENLTMKSQKGIEFISAKDITFKGSSKIKLKGSTAAMNKAVAKMGDQVVGMDIHQVNVPSPSGTVPTPLPHPYIGKLNDALSQNVVLDNKMVATKGSKSKHLSPGHIPTPPGVAFTKGHPSEIGEIALNTVPTVKVNSKEIAVLGSMVKTCSFPADAPNCQVVAVGAAVKVPIMMPGMDPDQFERDGGMVVNTRDLISNRDPANPPPTPEIRSAEWSGEQAFFGEEVVLRAELTNQYENATVFFNIWYEGADKERDIPLLRLTATNKGGQAEVKFRAQPPEEPPPEDDEVRYEFQVKSFKAEAICSGSISVKYFYMKKLEMADAHFNYDSGVLLPGLSVNYSRDADSATVSKTLEGVKMLQVCYNYIKEHSDQVILITGHTDRSGSFGYNRRLSFSRANSTLFALIGDKESWASDANEWYRVEDFISISKWINSNTNLGWMLPVTPYRHLKGRRAVPAELVKAYQRAYNSLQEEISDDSEMANRFKRGAIFAESLRVDGVMGRATWGSVLDLYYYVIMLDAPSICSESSPADDLMRLQESIKFIANDKRVRGCGEHRPRFQADQDGVRASANRRVEVMFFNEQLKAKLNDRMSCEECGPDSADCVELCEERCAIYIELRASIFVKVVKSVKYVEPKVFRLRLHKNQKPRKYLKYELRFLMSGSNPLTGEDTLIIVPGSETFNGRTNEEGKLGEHPIPLKATYAEVKVHYKEYDEEVDVEDRKLIGRWAKRLGKSVKRVDTYKMQIKHSVSSLETEVAYKLTNLGYQCQYTGKRANDKDKERVDKASAEFKLRNEIPENMDIYDRGVAKKVIDTRYCYRVENRSRKSISDRSKGDKSE